MNEFEEINNPFRDVPTEMMSKIFGFLPAKDLMQFRRVCRRWKSIIDTVACNDKVWTNYCMKDYKDYYLLAKKKANNDLSWYNLYKSLYIWPKLTCAVEKITFFLHVLQEVRGVEVIGNGIIAVHKTSKINYFDVKTLTTRARRPISGDYARYRENDTTIAILSYHLHLFVFRKLHNNTFKDHSEKYNDVKMFLLTDTKLFFVKLNDEIYVCDIINEPKIASKFMQHTEDLGGVMSLGYTKGYLHILTYQRNIYTIVNDNKMVFITSLDNEHNILNVLYKYNLLEQLDWRVYYQWMCELNRFIPEGPMQNISVMWSYAEIFFVGSNFGVLTIYYRPFINGELELFTAAPLRQLHLSERVPYGGERATCPILDIDVLETENGHTVFAVMPKKVAVLKYTHRFMKAAPWRALISK